MRTAAPGLPCKVDTFTARLPMSRRKASLIRILLLVALVYGAVVRIVAITQWKQGYSHDESISYLCAAATEGKYAKEIHGLTDTLITAGEIQAFYQRPDRLQPGTVADDLARHDIHPPLYFWALHAAYTWTGATLTAGAWLNFAAGLLLLLLTYTLARNTLGSVEAALAATVIWYLSPAVAQADLEARQYQFMAVCAMASYLLAWRMGRQGVTAKWLLPFVAVNALGFLDHYYYGFVLVPGVWLIWRRHGLAAPTWRFVGSIVASILLFIAAFPGFLYFLAHFGQRPTAGAVPPGFMAGVSTLVYTTLDFFAGQPRLRYPTLALLLAVAGLIGYKLFRGRVPVLRGAVTLPRYVAATLVWCAGFTMAFYLARISPASAAGEQYNAYFWPLLAIMLVYAGRWFIAGRYRPWVLTAYVLLLGHSFTFAVKDSDLLARMLPDAWYGRMGGPALLVTDQVERGVLPRVMRDVSSATHLYLVGKKWPDAGGFDRVVFLHLVGSKHKGPGSLPDILAAAGLHHRQTLTWTTSPEFDAYELRLYGR